MSINIDNIPRPSAAEVALNSCIRLIDQLPEADRSTVVRELYKRYPIFQMIAEPNMKEFLRQSVKKDIPAEYIQYAVGERFREQLIMFILEYRNTIKRNYEQDMTGKDYGWEAIKAEEVLDDLMNEFEITEKDIEYFVRRESYDGDGRETIIPPSPYAG